jgi:hypothetical protein
MTDLDELLLALSAVREEKTRAREIERDLLDQIHAAAETEGLRRKFDRGPWRIELASSANRKWDHDETTKHVVARALDDRQVNEATGEIEPSWAAVARAIRECGGIGYWRTGALKQRGLDPDEFAEITSRTPTVRMTTIAQETNDE